LPETLRLPDALRQQIVDHCRAGLPNEGCGLFAVEDDRVVEVYPTANAEESPTGYTIPPQEHFSALEDAESRGWEIGGVFHSHPAGPARPSMIDVQAALEPLWVYIVVGLQDVTEVRAWRITNHEIQEVMLT
jgi:proteasome lid subunit RPN8/RPN11